MTGKVIVFLLLGIVFYTPFFAFFSKKKELTREDVGQFLQSLKKQNPPLFSHLILFTSDSEAHLELLLECINTPEQCKREDFLMFWAENENITEETHAEYRALRKKMNLRAKELSTFDKQQAEDIIEGELLTKYYSSLLCKNNSYRCTFSTLKPHIALLYGILTGFAAAKQLP